jgi:16S rRNA (adenine1518-N6/adenine1519-N6)-dimethyltransferase
LFRPKKSLGQNFLQDENILRNISDSLHLGENDVVIEIGSGQGALTKHLVAKPIRLIGIEIDKRAVNILRMNYGTRMEILNSDFLKVDLFDISSGYGKKLRIVGNIPYYLTSGIVFRLFDSHTVVSDATIMVQLEVARRLVALPGNKDYGILSVLTKFYTESEILFRVSRNCFFPRPDVDSAVVSMKFKVVLPECDEKLMRSVVRETFGKRRKTLRNGLKSLGYDDGRLDDIRFDLRKRPEELSAEDFIQITNSLKRNEVA